jgi:hypothetical protein
MGIVDKVESAMHIGSSNKSSTKSSSTAPAPTHDPSTARSSLKEESRSETNPADRGMKSESTAAAADSATGVGEQVRTGDHTYDRHHNAPVVKENVRDEYKHNLQKNVQEEHDKTDVIHTVQPLKDNQVHDTQVHQKEHADQFKEVGQDKGAARETEEKLRAHRDEVAAQGGTEHAEDKHRFQENAPQVAHTERRHVVEEVQPVIEKDVLRPHQVNETQNVFVHHKEAPEFKETRVAPTMNVQDWERSEKSNDESQTFKGDSATRNL